MALINQINQQRDNLRVLKMFIAPVVTRDELKIMLDELPDGSALKVALGLLAVTAMRPAELVDLLWSGFHTDDQGNYLYVEHLCYKPICTVNKMHGKNYTYKLVRKEIFSQSPWLSKQLRLYREHSEPNQGGKVFPWSCAKSPQKMFEKKLRDCNKPQLAFLKEEISEVILGARQMKYRANLYTLRRFAITFHYEVMFKRDLAAIARYIGHSHVQTTLNHYVMPREAIGLTDEDIRKNVTFDKFVGLDAKKIRIPRVAELAMRQVSARFVAQEAKRKAVEAEVKQSSTRAVLVWASQHLLPDYEVAGYTIVGR